MHRWLGEDCHHDGEQDRNNRREPETLAKCLTRPLDVAGAEQIAHDGRHARTEEIAEGQIDVLDRHDDRDASETVSAQAPAHHETLEHDHNDLREHALTGHNCVAAHEFWNRL